MKFQKLFQNFFLSHIEKILSYPFKLKYLNGKKNVSHIEKHNFFLVNILLLFI
jgi:hypothetical protein